MSLRAQHGNPIKKLFQFNDFTSLKKTFEPVLSNVKELYLFDNFILGDCHAAPAMTLSASMFLPKMLPNY
jgi:hypothetical protein